MNRFESDARRRPTLRPSVDRLETRIALSALVSSATTAVTAPAGDATGTATGSASSTTGTTTTTSSTTTTDPSTTTTTLPNIQVVPLAAMTSASTQPPRVTHTQMLTRGNNVVGFVVRFSQAMDAGATQDLHNYHIYQLTQPNKYVARLLFQSDSPKAHSLQLKSATYLASADAVVLMLSSTPRAVGQFRVELANPAVPKGMTLGHPNVPPLASAQGTPLQGPKGPLGNPLMVPIMLQPGSRIQLDGLPQGAIPNLNT